MKRFALIAVIFMIGIISMPIMFGSDSRHEPPYYLHAGDVAANYSAEQLRAKEVVFLKEHAAKLGYKLVKGK